GVGPADRFLDRCCPIPSGGSQLYRGPEATGETAEVKKPTRQKRSWYRLRAPAGLPSRLGALPAIGQVGGGRVAPPASSASASARPVSTPTARHPSGAHSYPATTGFSVRKIVVDPLG